MKSWGFIFLNIKKRTENNYFIYQLAAARQMSPINTN